MPVRCRCDGGDADVLGGAVSEGRRNAVVGDGGIRFDDGDDGERNDRK